ncbi:MAG: hypothetical protein J7M40_17190, partial [Planctomycetes bacterium]|nr:hypothetical protein [Planctomycetota bacterium]
PYLPQAFSSIFGVRNFFLHLWPTQQHNPQFSLPSHLNRPHPICQSKKHIAKGDSTALHFDL